MSASYKAMSSCVRAVVLTSKSDAEQKEQKDDVAVNHDKNKAAQKETLKVIYFEETEALSEA